MGGLRTRKFTQLKTEYTEPGAEHNLYAIKTASGDKTWRPLGEYPTHKLGKATQDKIEQYGLCSACSVYFYCPHKGAGQIDCTRFKS